MAIHWKIDDLQEGGPPFRPAPPIPPLMMMISRIDIRLRQNDAVRAKEPASNEEVIYNFDGRGDYGSVCCRRCIFLKLHTFRKLEGPLTE